MADRLQPAALSGLRVFVVEDEPMVALYLEEALADFGCVLAGVAGRRAEAVDMAATIDCDAAIIDISLRGESSLAVAEALIKRGVPYVVATGYDSLPDGFPEGRVLAKPFVTEQLRHALEDCALLRKSSDARRG